MTHANTSLSLIFTYIAAIFMTKKFKDFKSCSYSVAFRIVLKQEFWEPFIFYVYVPLC